MTPFGKMTVHEDGSLHVDNCRRVTVQELGTAFGIDHDKRLVVALRKGDVIELRPLGTQRPETISAFDVYRYAILCRVNLVRLEKARATKESKARKRAAARIKYAEKQLTKGVA